MPTVSRRAAALLQCLEKDRNGRTLIAASRRLALHALHASIAELTELAPALLLSPLERAVEARRWPAGLHLTLEAVAVLLLLAEGEPRAVDPAPARPLPGEGSLRVLVTGATGFLGGVLARRLLARGARVTATGRRAAEERERTH